MESLNEDFCHILGNLDNGQFTFTPGIFLSLCIKDNAYVLIFTEQIRLLAGKSAKPDFHKKVLWLCLNHNPLIEKLDSITAFHFGNNFLVEVCYIIKLYALLNLLKQKYITSKKRVLCLYIY